MFFSLIACTVHTKRMAYQVQNVKDLRKFLGMVQCRDVWEKRSHLLAPLSNFVAESGHTKEKKKKGTKKRPLYWNESHQKSFGLMLSKKPLSVS